MSLYIPPECCENNQEQQNQTDIVSNYIIIAYHNHVDNCGKYRRFTVNLLRDYTFSYTFTNGEILTQDEINLYENEILNAQEKLTREREFYLRGRDLGVWNTSVNRTPEGAIRDNNTKYYSADNIY